MKSDVALDDDLSKNFKKLSKIYQKVLAKENPDDTENDNKSEWVDPNDDRKFKSKGDLYYLCIVDSIKCLSLNINS